MAVNPDVSCVAGGTGNLVFAEPINHILVDEESAAMRIDVNAMVIGPELAGTKLRRRWAKHRRENHTADKSAQGEIDRLEVFGFLERGWVIGRMACGLEFVEFAPALSGGAPDGIEEFTCAHVRRTGGRHQHTLGIERSNSEGSKTLVGSNGTGAFQFAFRERGRIENDQIEALGFVAEPIERVGLDGFMRAPCDHRVGLVEAKVAFGSLERVSADVEVGDGFGAAAGCVQREAAREAESIQDRAPGSKCLDAAPILALIEKETRFLAAQDVGFESQAGLKEDYRGIQRAAPQDLPIGSAELIGGQLLYITAQAENETFRDNGFREQIYNFIQPGQPDGGIEFQHECGAIAVQHESRPAVALAIDQAETGR